MLKRTGFPVARLRLCSSPPHTREGVAARALKSKPAALHLFKERNCLKSVAVVSFVEPGPLPQGEAPSMVAAFHFVSPATESCKAACRNGSNIANKNIQEMAGIVPGAFFKRGC